MNNYHSFCSFMLDLRMFSFTGLINTRGFSNVFQRPIHLLGDLPGSRLVKGFGFLAIFIRNSVLHDPTFLAHYGSCDYLFLFSRLSILLFSSSGLSCASWLTLWAYVYLFFHTTALRLPLILVLFSICHLTLMVKFLLLFIFGMR